MEYLVPLLHFAEWNSGTLVLSDEDVTNTASLSEVRPRLFRRGCNEHSVYQTRSIYHIKFHQQNIILAGMSGDRYFINDQNGLYFLTFTLIEWMDVFIRERYKRIIVDDLNYCVEHKGLEVFSWCLMTSHLHLVARINDGFKMSDFLRDFKKHTAMMVIKAISEGPESRQEWLLDKMRWKGRMDSRITQYKFWQEGNHAISLLPTMPEMIQQKVDYIHKNPVKEGIVEHAHEYLYSSARDYAGMKGLVKVSFI